MRYEWDEAKRVANLSKHGLDFIDVEPGFDWDLAAIIEDTRQDEPRFQAIGYLYDRVAVVVFTWRGEACRLISLRPADPRERRDYERF